MPLAQEIVGKTPVEGFFEVGCEEEPAGAGGSGCEVGLSFHDAVEQLPVVCGYVFDVTHVFESAFYFEGGDAGVYHVEQAVGG